MGAPCRVNVESPILDIPFLAIVIVFLPGLPLSAPRAMSTSPRTTRRLSTEATGIDDDSVHLGAGVGRSGLPGSGSGVVGYSTTIGVDPFSAAGTTGTLPGGLPRLEPGVRRGTAARDLMTDGLSFIMESGDGASAGSVSTSALAWKARGTPHMAFPASWWRWSGSRTARRTLGHALQHVLQIDHFRLLFICSFRGLWIGRMGVRLTRRTTP